MSSTGGVLPYRKVGKDKKVTCLQRSSEGAVLLYRKVGKGEKVTCLQRSREGRGFVIARWWRAGGEASSLWMITMLIFSMVIILVMFAVNVRIAHLTHCNDYISNDDSAGVQSWQRFRIVSKFTIVQTFIKFCFKFSSFSVLGSDLIIKLTFKSPGFTPVIIIKIIRL